MVNKKGWIRIVEVSFALLLIISVALIVSIKKNQENREDLTHEIASLLDYIAQNASLREKIASPAPDNAIPEINSIVESQININLYNYSAKICSYKDICPLVPYPSSASNDVYTAERVISATKDKIGLNKIKLFVWRK